MKERRQNIKVGDSVTLRLFTFNGGSQTDVAETQKVDIYKLFCVEPTPSNPDGRQHIVSYPESSIVRDEAGKYHLDVDLDAPMFTIGRYADVWTILFEAESTPATSEQDFQIAPNMWFTDSMPIVHDFTFDFTPNRIVKGEKKSLQISVQPNVPRGTIKQKYYENLTAAGNLYISMAQKCGNCLPQELDLRTIYDNEPVLDRDGCMSYFRFDTTDVDCGIYDVWFTLELGDNVFISEKFQLQIFD